MYNKHSKEKYGEAHYERAAEVLPSVGKFMNLLQTLNSVICTPCCFRMEDLESVARRRHYPFLQVHNFVIV